MTITTTEVAEILGVSTAAVRQMVVRGRLVPVRRGARPLKFREGDVWILKRDRMTPEQRARLRSCATRWAEMAG